MRLHAPVHPKRIAVRYTIMRQGVPLGEVVLDLSRDPAVGVVTPLAGYDAVRHLVRTATRALRATGLGGASGAPASEAALARGAAIGRELELRDERGALVPPILSSSRTGKVNRWR